jgi:hypothetical protein
MEFKKGYFIEEGDFIPEGSTITLTTVQGEVYKDVLLTVATKKKIGFQIDSELGSRVMDLELVESIEIA